MPVVSVTLNDKQLEILDHYRRTMGMSRSRAMRSLMTEELAKWQALVMDKEGNLYDN